MMSYFSRLQFWNHLEPVNDPHRNLPTVDLEAETSLESVLGSNPPIQCLEEADHWKPIVHPRRDIANGQRLNPNWKTMCLMRRKNDGNRKTSCIMSRR
uniref:Uncharacterized protein n=1 Tax=Bursaphelenchus xylophilus TaxID=6326 RepID=A0A1I7SJB3_BURXY